MNLKNFFVVILAGLFFTTACAVQIKDFILPFFPDTNTRKEIDEREMFSGVEGIDCIPDFSHYEAADLVQVIDGDSIRVAVNGTIFEVRYIGIDTPEIHSNQRQSAIEAAELNKELLSSEKIYLFKDVSETDKYNRLLRYVIANGRFINLELVRSGYAQAKTYFPDISCQSTFNLANN